ncbi:hypothetical protein C2S51_032113 [Perilla frutescens var. frutescens]|nr:hypothetical protein C2S51_032113 [Perilla frutescens var. frutescens]
MSTRSKGEPLQPFDPEIEATARHQNARRRRGTMADQQAAPITAKQMRQMQQQLAEMQQRFREQEEARATVPVPINQLFTLVLNHGQVPGPGINANNFELKSGLIGMVQQHQYGGHKTENPNAHLQQFLEICSTIKMNGVSDDSIRLRLFSFSLRDASKDWYHSLDLSTVDTWEALAHKFLHKFFPPGLTLKLKGEITQFCQYDDENLYEAWERFRELLRKYPNHGFGIDHQVCIFYNGCDTEGHDQAISIIEDMATNSYQWTNDRQVKIMRKAAAVEDTDPISKLAAQLSTLNAAINSRFDAMTCTGVENPVGNAMEDVNYVNQRGYGNNNHNYRGGNQFYQGNRSNLSYGNPNAALQPLPGFSVTNGVIDEDKKPKLDELLMAFMGKTEKYMGESQTRVEKLENAVGAMGTQMKMFEKHNITVNPNEQCKAIQLRSGTSYEGPKNPGHASTPEDENEKVEEDLEHPVPSTDGPTMPPPSSPPRAPAPASSSVPIPYPQRFQKKKIDEQF